MGTRADFYIGRGPTAEWLGSLPLDGYPEGIDAKVLACQSVEAFRQAVADFLKDEGMAPENGWPWMWEDSQMTDDAYAFDAASVHASCFGRAWFDPKKDVEKHDNAAPRAVFPTMLRGSDLRNWRAMQKTFAAAAKPRPAKNSS